MDPENIGDSHDFAKRTFLGIRPHGKPFISIPMFTTPPDLDELECYRTILNVELIGEELQSAPTVVDRLQWADRIAARLTGCGYNIFLDPDRGIRLSDQMPPSIRAQKYVSTLDIRTILRRSRQALLLCFDRSHDRRSVEESRAQKMEYLRQWHIHTAYFVSHFTILVASFDPEALQFWIDGASALGNPATRIHRLPPQEPGPPLPD